MTYAIDYLPGSSLICNQNTEVVLRVVRTTKK